MSEWGYPKEARIGALGLWKHRRTVWVRWNGVPKFGVRFGRDGVRLFSERHQGTRGIPKRHFYLFGGRLTVIKPRQRKGAA